MGAVGAGGAVTLATELGRVLVEELPITQSLRIRVLRADESGVLLALPLAANRNHKGTVFAGSLNAVATLAGWGVCWAVLRDAGIDGHGVIQDAAVRYLVPAASDVTAWAARPVPVVADRVLRTLARRGRARLPLAAEVRDQASVLVATLQGRYVVQQRKPG